MTKTPDFDELYASDPDPWRVATSWYEQRKLDLVCACLRRPTYDVAWDPACGTGHLARRLAGRCDRVLATDRSGQAVDVARSICTAAANVTLAVNVLPDAPSPLARFDLVVLSEFVYYLTGPARARTYAMIDELAADRSELVSVHWRHLPHDAYLSGEDCQHEIVSTFQGRGWAVLAHHDDEDFLVDVMVRSGGPETADDRT